MTIKKICTLHYEIELYETPKGYFQVAYTVLGNVIKTKPTLDFNLANHSFNAYLAELVGN